MKTVRNEITDPKDREQKSFKEQQQKKESLKNHQKIYNGQNIIELKIYQICTLKF